MLLRNSITTIALATALTTVLTTVFLAGAGARADDASKYPDWKGQWVGVGAAADAVDALAIAAATRHGVTRGIAALATVVGAAATAGVGVWAAREVRPRRRFRSRG